jgi:hypothetical protein
MILGAPTTGGEDQEPEGIGASRQARGNDTCQERGLGRQESGLFLGSMTENWAARSRFSNTG